jgi:peptidyl-tRNA hydrolase
LIDQPYFREILNHHGSVLQHVLQSIHEVESNSIATAIRCATKFVKECLEKFQMKKSIVLFTVTQNHQEI